MIGLYSLIYVCLLTILSNCYIFIYKYGVALGICIFVFILINCVAGIFVVKARAKRLKFLYHGTVLLLSFCFSVTTSAIVNIMLLKNILYVSKSLIIVNIIYCIIANLVLFWNGIICVYLTSVQLGIKTRVAGLIFGLIPIANLIALGIIIFKTYDEVVFEIEKDALNNKRKSRKICKTKYPILFVHGVFFRDYEHLNYWGRIPNELKINGAVCYYGNHESALSVKRSGEQLSERIKKIVEETHCEKVNIIAHSKGGLDCRYALKYCGISKYVASLTTINTPHRGCLFADWLLNNAPKQFKESVANTYNKAAKILGDKRPDFLEAVNDLTAEFCLDFDRNTELPSNVFCQSVGSVMKKAASGKFPLNLTHNFVEMFSGKNDGLVGIESFKWGSKYTLLTNSHKRGISHGDMIDLNRENIKGFDVREFYVGLVSDLKNRGM